MPKASSPQRCFALRIQQVYFFRYKSLDFAEFLMTQPLLFLLFLFILCFDLLQLKLLRAALQEVSHSKIHADRQNDHDERPEL